jgi:hypothetical protein
VHPSFSARQRLGKNVLAAISTRNMNGMRISLGRCILQSLYFKSGVETLPRQGRIVGGAGFYAIRVMKRNRQILAELLSFLNVIPLNGGRDIIRF